MVQGPPKYYPTENDITTIIKAIDNGSTTIVSSYIERGVNPNTTNMAVRSNQDSITDLLIRANGVDTYARNKNNETPLILAITLGYRRIAYQIYTFTCASIASFKVPNYVIVIDFKSSLGAGGFGCVFKGTFANEEVAVKTAHEGSENILRQEISIMTNQGPHSPKLALQYMDCGDLRQYLNAKRDGLPTAINVTPLEVAWILANALADFHHNRALHRDLKSQNIVLSTKHYIKLDDLGISQAPEVLQGECYDYAADVYSFGVILTELDTLHLPYSDLKLSVWNIAERVREGILTPRLSSSVPSQKCKTMNHISSTECTSCSSTMSTTTDKISTIVKRSLTMECPECLGENDLRAYKEKKLLKAARRGYTSTVKTLLEQGANINCKDNDSNTPLHFAASKGQGATVLALLNGGAFVDSRKNTGETPLHRAVASKQGLIINLLLNAGASIDLIRNDGWTPLHVAAKNGDNEAVTTLIEAGASTTIYENIFPDSAITMTRDLKSQNISLSTKHYIKLDDLGISREFTQNTMTQAETPFWEAPEVLQGECYDFAADVYSFGVILTELDTLHLTYSDLKLSVWNIAERV
ncbi:hypothetical protein THRCLA_01372 [Thraustotheca clavata]|uniref:Protein kinase domain-containing protein n=1 Tax=Thraustotheca clavata TaxID=74557 RepID=A0A1W0A8J0_9STRA|nr:hypothetical protein THRCLA_01372 [Thraustotheca clavata]